MSENVSPSSRWHRHSLTTLPQLSTRHARLISAVRKAAKETVLAPDLQPTQSLTGRKEWSEDAQKRAKSACKTGAYLWHADTFVRGLPSPSSFVARG